MITVLDIVLHMKFFQILHLLLYFPFRHLAVESKYSSRVLEMLKNPESEEINLDLIVALIQHICVTKNNGAILIFLPGWDKISNLHKLLKESLNFPSCKYNLKQIHNFSMYL
jgi:HrpA-like RNA helicase